MVPFAMLSALVAIGCFTAAWHYWLLAAANTVEGIPMPQALMSPSRMNRDLYTAVGQRYLARSHRFVLGLVLSAILAVWLFARAGYQLPERRITDQPGLVSDQLSNDR